MHVPANRHDPRAVADEVAAFAAAGATTVVLQPAREEDDPEAYVRFTAEQVRPLVP